MKTSPALMFEQAMRQRGYSLDELAFCIVSRDADQITFDETHPGFPKRPRSPIVFSSGPGTEMKALLARIGIVASPTCSCNKRAKVMDEKGCDWCAENIDEIDRWLAEEAKKRKLPYLSLAGKTLIRLAIHRARKKGNG